MDAVNRIVREMGREVDVVETVVHPDDAERLRFLGSPSVRVNGRDVELGAERRAIFGYSCRTYDTDAGTTGVPLDDWIKSALQDAHGKSAQ